MVGGTKLILVEIPNSLFVFIYQMNNFYPYIKLTFLPMVY